MAASGNQKDPATRAAVLEAVEAGQPYRQIAAEHGIAIVTISKWAKAAGITANRRAQTEDAARATQLAWAKRRGDLVDDMGDVAHEMLERALDADTARDAKDYAVTVAVLVDKAQLLSGGVTSRFEQVNLDKQRERVAAMGDELAEKRAEKTGTTGG